MNRGKLEKYLYPMSLTRWRLMSRRWACRVKPQGRRLWAIAKIAMCALPKKVRRQLAFGFLFVATLSSMLLLSEVGAGAATGAIQSAPSPSLRRVWISSDSDQGIANNAAFTLLSTGQQQYESGQLSTALQSWQQVAQDPSVPSLQQALGWSYASIAAQDLGDWSEAEDAIARSLALLENQPKTRDSQQMQAQVLNVQGRLSLKKGQPESAWEIWQLAEAAYRTIDDVMGLTGAQINQAQALQTMGLYRRSRLLLETISQELEAQPDSKLKAIALKSLGDVVQTSGNLDQSRQHLEKSLALFQQLGSEADVAGVMFSLANTFRLMGDTEAAIEKYQELEAIVPARSTIKTKAQLNRLGVLLDSQQWNAAEQLLPHVVSQVEALPASRDAIYASVNLADRLLSSGDDTHQPLTWVPLETVSAWLHERAQQAQSLEDHRAESLSLGELSKVYSYANQWDSAGALAQRAIDLSQNSNAQDIEYRWQQQLGRIYRAQGKEKKAIESYTAAVETLGKVRRDLLATNADVQFSFRETVEPVYRELVSLLLLPDDVDERSLNQARETIEELQLAELENYFRSACIDSSTEYIDTLDQQAAVLYPIVLPDRVEVILSLPDGPLQHYRTWQSEEKTDQVLTELYEYFNPGLSSNKRLRLSQQVYDWLIAPADQTLSDSDIQTLVFVLDGKFRNVPMPALYDGQQYLIEKYGVALTPGLKLLGPHFQKPKPLQALMLGLTQARDGFSALPGVKREIEQISSRVKAEVLVDENFTQQSLQSSIDRLPFPILHLATHGQFSSDLEKTFLLAWDRRITLGELDDVLRSRSQQNEPIELMILSACQTAEGDDRAALGLAGMAIRSGARSTLATLWSVNDASTALLMAEFYKELEKTELTKAEALRQAQISVLKNTEFSHPFYWSPFVLIGNWLS